MVVKGVLMNNKTLKKANKNARWESLGVERTRGGLLAEFPHYPRGICYSSFFFKWFPQET